MMCHLMSGMHSLRTGERHDRVFAPMERRCGQRCRRVCRGRRLYRHRHHCCRCWRNIVMRSTLLDRRETGKRHHTRGNRCRRGRR